MLARAAEFAEIDDLLVVRNMKILLCQEKFFISLYFTSFVQKILTYKDEIP